MFLESMKCTTRKSSLSTHKSQKYLNKHNQMNENKLKALLVRIEISRLKTLTILLSH